MRISETQEAARWIAKFDSAAAMLQATARFLQGRDFPALGTRSPLRFLTPFLNALPGSLREWIYTWGGWSEAINPRTLKQVRAEAICRWAVNHYPRHSYPAIMLGSSNGALVHLCAALNTPWLPQTVLLPVRLPHLHPDDPCRDLEEGKRVAPWLLEANPDLQLHHMHDGNQDRLMIQRMAYFRVKLLHLTAAYRCFLEEVLTPGATIVLVECQQHWPATMIGERHLFQHGALGGATPEEYLSGGPRVEDYLRRYHSPYHQWRSPSPDGEYPEAEWGFVPSLREDVEIFARQHGYQVKRLIFDDPQQLSPLVADLYRWWYQQRHLPTNRLLVESFILLEPYWALRTGSVPFWMLFNVDASAQALEAYLHSTDPYDEIRLMLFSHGVDSIGCVPIACWKKLLAHARKQGTFMGVDEQAYPRDFATLTRYHTALKQVSDHVALPDPLPLASFESFLQQATGGYQVRWLEGEG